MVAMDVTKSGIRDKRLVKWSHPAPAGSFPTSWDETDTTKDTGEVHLGETEGAILDSLTLRDVNLIYKDDSIHGMQHVGGIGIFRFFQIFGEYGALGKNCVVQFEAGKHLVFGRDDVFVHDGLVGTTLFRAVVNGSRLVTNGAPYCFDMETVQG